MFMLILQGFFVLIRRLLFVNLMCEKEWLLTAFFINFFHTLKSQDIINFYTFFVENFRRVFL